MWLHLFCLSMASDQYNHPAEHSRLDFTQSWKRTGGWALERILERHYGPDLAAHGINLVIADGERKLRLLSGIDVGHRLEADKMDVLLTVGSGSTEKLIGVVHVVLFTLRQALPSEEQMMYRSAKLSLKLVMFRHSGPWTVRACPQRVQPIGVSWAQYSPGKVQTLGVQSVKTLKTTVISRPALRTTETLSQPPQPIRRGRAL